ncbi:hypothetical protein GGR51DRAFT_553857 [Nemania sp. FL0031]|nr:hypothetical protein GGR51DRAFT_553857 [Nemania sp. FL0031]
MFIRKFGNDKTSQGSYAAYRGIHFISLSSSDHETSKDTINRLSDQILVLRPYRTAFNRENAQSAFENLLFSIEGWVERFTDMFIDDQRFANEHVRFVNQHRHILIQFQELLASNQDLSSAVGYPDNDQNILAALIFRYVEQRIFGQTPCGISPLMAELLQEIQNTLPHCTSPPVDMTAISAWRGQAYHALFSQPNYPEARQRGINALSSELADILRFICAPGGWPAFVRSISSKIIEPSVRLDENFRRAHEEYYFDTASWTEPGGNMSELKGLLSVNAARFNAQMDVSELYPTPSMGQLREHFICSLHPALKAKEVRKLNQGENVRQSATLFKEKVLVAWDPETVQGRDPATMKQKTWLSRIATP